MDRVGALPFGQSEPVPAGQHPLHGEDLPGDEARGELVGDLGERGGQHLLVEGHVVEQAGGQAGCGEDHPVVAEHLGVVVQPRHRVAPVEPGQEVTTERGQRRLPRRALADDPGGLALVVGDPVQDEIFLGGEVFEQGGFGDPRRRRDLGDRDLVESALQEQRDRRRGDRLVDLPPLAFPQPCHRSTLTES
ncbi:hypothetical protein GCM10010517_33820 [Streptosporangium fragile]|uniref:Uncharacterized protein n=1 Tax=Streptosporangium fragile TaxID=46186 RepID=A0ABP6IDR9_9ACTN